MTAEAESDRTARLQLVVELLQVLRDHFGSRDARGRAIDEALEQLRRVPTSELETIVDAAAELVESNALGPSPLARLLEILTADVDALPAADELRDRLQRADEGPARFHESSTPESEVAWTHAVATFGALVAFDVVREDLEQAIERQDLGQLRRRLRGLAHRYSLLDRPRSGDGPHVTVGGGRVASVAALRSRLDAWHA